MIADIELFPYYTANHVWFLYGILHWAGMGQKRVFIIADFKLESIKMFLKTFC